jgi:DNA-binding NarL/FixJ family response regulator
LVELPLIANEILPAGAGFTNKDIAQTPVLSVRTVEAYLRSIYGKLGVHSRTEAALWAVKHPDLTGL